MAFVEWIIEEKKSIIFRYSKYIILGILIILIVPLVLEQKI